MIFDIKELIHSLSSGLDVIESEVMGVSANHGKRVGALSAFMGMQLGWGEVQLVSVAASALLHDNALTEYLLSERAGTAAGQFLRLHCELGQRNIDSLPFDCDVEGYVLYHHERADGTGPFGKTADEQPMGAQIISAANHIDETFHLQRMGADDLPLLKSYIRENTGTVYTELASEALSNVLTEEALAFLSDESLKSTRERFLPPWYIDVEDEGMLRISEFIGRVIDYKSLFTRKHTQSIARRAWLMGEYYGYSRVLKAKLFLAAALHDLGKLYVPSDILEKPGKLTPDEYEVIMTHVSYTYELLKDVEGLEDICQWASNHHEKLDGSGYPFGKTLEELDFNSRLMACIDIYQAVSEERPYHPERSHEDTMEVLLSMAERGKVDAQIVADMNTAMAPYSLKELPSPIR